MIRRIKRFISWPWRKVRDSWQRAMRRRYGCKVCIDGACGDNMYISTLNIDTIGSEKKEEAKPKEKFIELEFETGFEDMDGDLFKHLRKQPREYDLSIFYEQKKNDEEVNDE